jgi:dTDP-4-amino-4,6-dideoxygalactose transaminase
LELENKEFIKRPTLLKHSSHTAHIYYILTKNKNERKSLMHFLLEKKIEATFHYAPLHLSKFGKKLKKNKIKLPNSESVSERIVRLPLWPSMKNENQIIISYIKDFYKKN